MPSNPYGAINNLSLANGTQKNEQNTILKRVIYPAEISPVLNHLTAFELLKVMNFSMILTVGKV